MKILLILIFFTVTSNYSYAESSKLGVLVSEIDLNRYDISELQVKEAILTAILYRGWTIDEHKRFSITATVKEKYKLTININGRKIQLVMTGISKKRGRIKRWSTLIIKDVNAHAVISHHSSKANILIQKANTKI